MKMHAQIAIENLRTRNYLKFFILISVKEKEGYWLANKAYKMHTSFFILTVLQTGNNFHAVCCKISNGIPMSAILYHEFTFLPS